MYWCSCLTSLGGGPVRALRDHLGTAMERYLKPGSTAWVYVRRIDVPQDETIPIGEIDVGPDGTVDLSVVALAIVGHRPSGEIVQLASTPVEIEHVGDPVTARIVPPEPSTNGDHAGVDDASAFADVPSSELPRAPWVEEVASRSLEDELLADPLEDEEPID
jgi:hypothetical protein